MDEKICLVYVTASNKDEAEKIGDELLSARLAACVNIRDGITAMYWWEGKKEKADEAAIFIKTKSSLIPEVKEKILQVHSYSCPCILVFEAADADAKYADWVISETKEK